MWNHQKKFKDTQIQMVLQKGRSQDSRRKQRYRPIRGSWIEGHQNQAATISWWQLRSMASISSVGCCLRSDQILNFLNHSYTQSLQFPRFKISTFTDRQECDGEVIGCLNMLTRMYRTSRRQHNSRRSRTSCHEQIHYKTKKIEQQHILTQDTM